MPRISAKNLSLVVDGKSVEIKNPQKGNFDLNKSLLTDEGFAKFADNPQKFAKEHGLSIDKDISAVLASKMKGLKSLEEAHRILNPMEMRATTVWAVVSAAYSVATAKVAVAF